MIEEWWSSGLKGDSVWVTYFDHRSLHKGSTWSVSEEHDKSVAGEEGCAAL